MQPHYPRFLAALTVAIAFSVIAVGCRPMPKIDDLHGQLSALSDAADPVRFLRLGEPVDVEANIAPTLSLPAAVEAVVHHDPDLQASLARVRVTLAEARQVRLLPNPILSVSVRYPEGGGKPIIDAGLTADFISLLTKPRQSRAADARVRAACAEALQTALDVVAEVQEVYFNVQALEAEVRVLEERRRIIDRLLELARARVQAGESGQLDVITLDAEKAELETDFIATLAERRDQRLALGRLLGRPSDTAEWTLPPWERPVATQGDEQRWITNALDRRPEVQAQIWELAALGDQVALASLIPFEGTEIGASAERDGEWSVGPAIAVPVPFLDWGQARREQARANVVEARHRLTKTRRKVVEEVRRAWASYQSTGQALDMALSHLVPLQERRREQAEAAYKNGFADITAVLLAEQGLQASRSKLAELQKKTSIAHVRLQRATGGSAAMSQRLSSTVPTTNTSATTPKNGA